MLFARKLIIGVLIAFCSWYILTDYLFDEDNITHLAGRYYTANYDDGVALHWYEDDNKPYGEPLLGKIYAAQVGSGYLVARAGADFYFMFPLNAATIKEAQQKRMGPFLKPELINKLLLLSGDTVLRETGPF